jgi:hypothetical protein
MMRESRLTVDEDGFTPDGMFRPDILERKREKELNKIVYDVKDDNVCLFFFF